MEVHDVVTLSGIDGERAMISIFNNGQLANYNMGIGHAIQVGFKIEVPDFMVKQIKLQSAGNVLIGEHGLHDHIAAQLHSIIVEARDNPGFKFDDAVKELEGIYHGYYYGQDDA